MKHLHNSAYSYQRLTRWRTVLGFSCLSACLVTVSSCAIWSSESGSDPIALADEIVAVDATTAELGGLGTEPTYTGTTQPFQQVLV